jgi:ribosomal protein L11 methyltransferase
VNDSTSKGIVADVSDATLDARILDVVTDSLERLTPMEVKRRVGKADQPLARGRIESSIKRLVEQKALVYTYQFGNSFLEPSYEKPVRVTDSIVLKPPACDYDPLPGDIVVNINAGAAFGTGCHPTTRLSLMGLEKVCTGNLMPMRTENCRVLDIGTGSGVLAIAALKMGIDQGIGLDIDPCARAEASENVLLNALSERMVISDQSLDSLEGRFLLITANLRLPTLMAYFDKMSALMEKEGCLVISGIKDNEIKPLKRVSDLHEMQVCWEGKALGWGGLALRRGT